MQTSSMFPSGTAYPEPPTAMATPAPAAGPFQPSPVALPPTGPMAPGGPFGSPPLVPGPQPSAVQDRLKFLVPAIVAAFGPKFGPQGTASLLTGLMRGRNNKLAQQERLEDTQRRRALEAAEFQQNATMELMKSASPEEMQAKLAALGPMAQYHGVDLQGAMGSAQGVVAQRQAETVGAKDRNEARALLERLEKKFPGQNFTTTLNGRRVSKAELEAIAEESALDPATGEPLQRQAPRSAPVSLARGARLVNPDTGETVAEGASEGPNAGTFEDYLTRLETERGKPLSAVEVRRQRASWEAAGRAPTQSAGGGAAEWVRTAAGDVVKRSAQPGDTPYSATMARDEMNKGNRGQARSSMVAKARETIKLLREKPGMGGAVGAGFQKAIPFIDGPLPGTDARTYTQYINALKSQLTLPELEKMRGLGALSDREFRTLSEGATALDASMSEEAFLEELDRIDTALEEMARAPIASGDAVVIDPKTRGGSNVSGRVNPFR